MNHTSLERFEGLKSHHQSLPQKYSNRSWNRTIILSAVDVDLFLRFKVLCWTMQFVFQNQDYWNKDKAQMLYTILVYILSHAGRSLSIIHL